MTGRIAAIVGGTAGLLVLIYNVLNVAYHFHSLSMPSKVGVGVIALFIAIFVLMVGYYSLQLLLGKVAAWWRRSRRP